MDNRLLDLVSDLKGTPDGLTAWDVAESYFRSLQFEVVNCAVLEKNGGSLLGFFSNMSEDWMSHYLDSGYDLCDPWVKHVVDNKPDFVYLQENKESFATTDAARCELLMQEVEHEGIRSSVLSPFQNRSSDHLVGINLGSDLPSAEFLKLIDSHRMEVFVGLALVQNHMLGVFSDIREVAPWFPGKVRKDILTPREREVLLWLSKGLRNDRISEKMNVAVVTVNFHMQSIKQKLGARTREQAVAIAVAKKIIEP